MHPPKAACEALAKIDRGQFRLAWQGSPDGTGCFAVVALYTHRDAGTPDEPVSFREFWDVVPRLSETGELFNQKIDRGPIFAKDGSCRRDWDPLFRVPMFEMTLDESYKYADGSPIRNIWDVFSGKFIEAIKHNVKPIVKRVVDQRRGAARDLDRRASDLGGEIGGYLWREANKTGQTGNHTITTQERVDAMKRLDRRKWRTASFEDDFLPPMPKGHSV